MEAARPAVVDDLPRLAELVAQAREELGPTRGGRVFLAKEARADRPNLAAGIDDPDRAVWSGTIDGFVVGYASAHHEELQDGTRLGVIDSLFVEPQARAVGVGEALVNLVVDWCSARGCGGIDATALPGNRATKNFFEASGFTARLLVMHRHLGE
jgi:GNAT superfamily N-acetyltransferase